MRQRKSVMAFEEGHTRVKDPGLLSHSTGIASDAGFDGGQDASGELHFESVERV